MILGWGYVGSLRLRSEIPSVPRSAELLFWFLWTCFGLAATIYASRELEIAVSRGYFLSKHNQHIVRGISRRYPVFLGLHVLAAGLGAVAAVQGIVLGLKRRQRP